MNQKRRLDSCGEETAKIRWSIKERRVRVFTETRSVSVAVKVFSIGIPNEIPEPSLDWGRFAGFDMSSLGGRITIITLCLSHRIAQLGKVEQTPPIRS